VAAAALVATVADARPTAGNNTRPHILHVIVDDLGWGNTGYSRTAADATPEIQTPNLDALVDNGVRFMRHYVHAMCTPTRVSFQTGSVARSPDAAYKQRDHGNRSLLAFSQRVVACRRARAHTQTLTHSLTRMPLGSLACTAPTRRVPAHSGQLSLCSPTDLSCGIPFNATTISQKMAAAGYATHFVGKWDCGAATPHHTPFGRNYSTALNYFGHGNYQWGELEWNGNFRDLWLNDKPAAALANASRDKMIYEEVIFREQLLGIVDAHPPGLPLFLVYAARIAHYPIQAPIEYQKLPHIAKIDTPHRLV
jgi:arylsulfatase B